ncbi:MAG: UDP-N-acetylmuramoyl-L-alanyl-D-glutamate--2,6-diaminopimelate ligase [Gallionella sp.]|nr:UDP-N-acetylmuramoyl-L-alanyl-D-glutamate--2,6-diaminopimelate ligase [Gallionella sp.]
MSASPDLLSALNVKITRLVTDSREVMQGDTFVAYPGESSDGRRFIAQAIAQGANAVIWEARDFAWNDSWRVPNLAVTDLRHQAGRLAHAVYGAPSEKLWLVGVTGTNGKTSTSHWVAQALGDAGRKCALIGTLGNGYPGALQASANTTPDAVRVHGLFAEYLHDGAQAVAMEVSSHALAQGRVNAAHFDVALLTNLSRDHLDYHGDMQSYAASKRRLFDWETLKCVVLNLDDGYGVELAEALCGGAAEVVGYGMSAAALQLAERLGLRMVYGDLMGMSGRGLQLEVHSSWGGARIESPLIGRFNAENLLGALAVLMVSDIGLEDAVRSLWRVQAVAGRMQRLGGSEQPTVVVDYAHTPDALEKVLLALREVSAAESGKLICVFGCGGDRDRGKRPMMGRVAEQFADHCIVTSDNPRGEESESIIAETMAGMELSNHEIVVERGAAIARAIVLARRCDTVLIAGKGHEAYQEIDGVKYPFSDLAVAGQALKQWEARP